jgi:hypothetical protein
MLVGGKTVGYTSDECAASSVAGGSRRTRLNAAMQHLPLVSRDTRKVKRIETEKDKNAMKDTDPEALSISPARLLL